MRQRSYLKVNVGNLLEVTAAIVGAYGVYRLVGFAWALIGCFILLVALAEWVFPTSVWRVPLPHHFHLGVRLKEYRQSFKIRRYRLKARWRSRRST